MRKHFFACLLCSEYSVLWVPGKGYRYMKRQVPCPQEVGSGFSEWQTWQQTPGKGQSAAGKSRDQLCPAHCYAPRKYLFREGEGSSPSFSTLPIWQRPVGIRAQEFGCLPISRNKCLLSISQGYDTSFLESLCVLKIFWFVHFQKDENHLVLPYLISPLPLSKG